MSIINDALKKVQENMENPASNEPSPATPEQPPRASIYPIGRNTAKEAAASGKKSKEPAQVQKSKTPQLLLMLLITMGAFAAYQIKTNPDLIKKIKRTSIPIPQVIKNIPATTPKPKPAPVEVYEPGEIVVKGTMNSGDKWMALINGKIYEVGETIEGNYITTITLDGIEVTRGDSKKFISVQGKTPVPIP